MLSEKRRVLDGPLLLFVVFLLTLFGLFAWAFNTQQVRQLRAFNAELLRQNQKLTVENDALATVCGTQKRTSGSKTGGNFVD